MVENQLVLALDVDIQEENLDNTYALDKDLQKENHSKDLEKDIEEQKKVAIVYRTKKNHPQIVPIDLRTAIKDHIYNQVVVDDANLQKHSIIRGIKKRFK